MQYLVDEVLGEKHMPHLLAAVNALGIPGGGKAFDQLTTTNMRRFNDETPDSPDVRYFSYGAEFEAGWSNPFRIPWGIVKEREGEWRMFVLPPPPEALRQIGQSGANDGLVSVESARWGTYQHTLINVNHLDLIGWVGKVSLQRSAVLGGI